MHGQLSNLADGKNSPLENVYIFLNKEVILTFILLLLGTLPWFETISADKQ